MEKKYVIGEKTFVQKKMVLAQLRRFFQELKSVQGNEKDMLDYTSDKFPRLLASILIEEGKGFPKTDEDFADIAKFLDENLEIEMIGDIMNDFLSSKPMGQKMILNLSEEKKET